MPITTTRRASCGQERKKDDARVIGKKLPSSLTRFRHSGDKNEVFGDS